MAELPPTSDKDVAYTSMAELEQADEDIVYARTIFDGVTALQDTPRVSGKLYPTVMDAFTSTVLDWQQKFPNITAQEIAVLTKSTDFTDYTARQHIITEHGISAEELAVLRPRHLFHVDKNVQTYGADLALQQLPAGLLDIPDYIPQLTVLGCMTSCYRMIFKAIAGNSLEAPCELAMTSLSEYGGFTFDEEALFKSFSTALFRQRASHLVTNRVILGADFADITKRAARLRQRVPGVKVYATVGLKNFDPDSTRLHGAVLLDADEDTVRFHNPWAREHRRTADCTYHNSDSCGAYETLDKTEFIERWAASMHEVRLVIAQPNTTGTN